MIEKKVLIDNLKVNYKISGSGFPLLILHGWGAGSDSWIEVQDILAKKGFKVICPDLPGFGKSPDPPDIWGMDDYVGLVSKFAEGLQIDKFFLLGHSMGGGVATEFASLYPEKVKALILCGAAVIREKENFSWRQKIAFYLTKASYVIFGIPIFKKKLYSLGRKIVYKIAGVYDYYMADRLMKEVFKKVSGNNLRDCAAKIKVPTLIIWGDKDQTMPLKHAFILNNIISGSQLSIMKGIDHSPHRKVPEELSEIIFKFLSSQL